MEVSLQTTTGSKTSLQLCELWIMATKTNIKCPVTLKHDSNSLCLNAFTIQENLLWKCQTDSAAVHLLCSLYFPGNVRQARLRTCPDIAACFWAAFSTPLMNLFTISLHQAPLKYGDFMTLTEGGGTASRGSSQPSIPYCILQPGSDPSPCADLSPSDTLCVALWCDVCSNVQ